MSTTATQSSEGPDMGASGDSTDTDPEAWDPETLRTRIGIQTQPAEAIIDAFDGWDDLGAAVGDDDSLEDIEGVGPKTAETVRSAILVEQAQEAAAEAIEDAETEDENEGCDSVESGEEEEEGGASEDAEDEATPDPDDEEEAAVSGGNDNDGGEADDGTSTSVGTTEDIGNDGDEFPHYENAPGAFEATVEGSVIQSIVETYTPIVDEGKFHVSERGLRVTVVDPANVAMRDGEFTTSAFESWNTDGGVLGINLDRLSDVVNMADSDEQIRIELTESKTLKLMFDGLKYTLALIDPDSIRKEPELPDLNFDARFEIEAGNIHDAKDAADMVSDHISLQAGGPRSDLGEVVVAEANGDTDDVTVTWEPADELEQSRLPRGDDEAISLFSLEYMKDLLKNVNDDKPLQFMFGDDFPVMIEHETADGYGTIVSMLAPRIQD